MKILHTADWHLGKRLDACSRLEEQILVLEEIVQIADREQVDVVLIAGDLFDNFNPAVEAVELFYKTLKRLSLDGKRPVIAIAGNHDSPNFISAPDPLAKACGIILIGKPKEMVSQYDWEHFQLVQADEGFMALKLNHIDFPLRIIHTAYANEQRLKENLGENKEEHLNLVLQQHWQNLATDYCDEQGVNLLMTHLYMNKRGSVLLEEPEGEKPIKIGNADLIFADIIPEAIQYVALGHLHAYRNIGTQEKPVVYASSPLSYSFAEAGQTKYVQIVEMQPGQEVSVRPVPLSSGRKLFREKFEDVSVAIEWLQKNPYTWVELTIVSDTFLTASERKSIFQAHDGIVYLIPVVKDKGQAAIASASIDLSQDMNALFVDYFKLRNNGVAPNEEILDLFNEILNSES